MTSPIAVVIPGGVGFGIGLLLAGPLGAGVGVMLGVALGVVASQTELDIDESRPDSNDTTEHTPSEN
ncbi:hypothetical protein [Haloferax sp. DFSO60]|uniref:hypothetical protein n=1 Tax=Haloferax sp. DFSO60 TaxID=3388652 RepID=UPI003979D5D5